MAEPRVYVGERAYFPEHGVWLDSGDEVPFPTNPDDPRFVTHAAAKKHKPATEEN